MATFRFVFKLIIKAHLSCLDARAPNVLPPTITHPIVDVAIKLGAETHGSLLGTVSQCPPDFSAQNVCYSSNLALRSGNKSVLSIP